MYLSFVYAVNEAHVRVTKPRGHAGYSWGSAQSYGRSATIENPHTTITSYVYTRKSAYYGAGSGIAKGQACVDIPFWFDSCSEADVGPA